MILKILQTNSINSIHLKGLQSIGNKLPTIAFAEGQDLAYCLNLVIKEKYNFNEELMSFYPEYCPVIL